MGLKRKLLSIFIVSIIMFLNFGIVIDSAFIAFFDVSESNEEPHFEHAPAGCSDYSFNPIQRPTYKIFYRELSYNKPFCINTSFLKLGNASDFNLLFHIQRNRLYIARLKAG